MSTKPHLYRISFVNQGQVFEIYAKRVSHGGMPGFVEVEQLVFGEKSSLVVDPAEEKLKTEFADVIRTYVPMHAVIRIDEVSKRGAARVHLVSGDTSKVTMFPLYTSGSDHHKK